MNFRRYLCQRLFALFCPLLLSLSQLSVASDIPDRLSFQNIMEGKDIALGEVEALLQDSEGFMWLGGRNALLRYDGYDFKAIELVEDPLDPSKNHIFGQITDLVEDQQQQIWVASRSGLVLYDREQEVARRLVQTNGKPLQIYNDTVNRAALSPAGKILAGAYNGLNLVDAKSHNAELYIHDPNDATSIASNVVHDIFVDSKDQIWLGTDAGISLFDERHGVFTNYIPFPENPSSLPDNAVWAIAEDQQGLYWLATRKGLYVFNHQQNSFKRYLHDPERSQSLAADILMDVFVDHNGWVWVGTDTAGVSMYKPEIDGFVHFQANGSLGSISADSIRRFYEDAQGDMWIGTYPSGLNFHDRSSAAISWYTHDAGHPNGLGSNTVSAVMEDKKGNLWVGTGGGVDYFDRKSGQFKHYRHNPGGESKILANAIIGGMLDHKDAPWFGTWAGSFHHYLADEDRFEQLPFDGTLAALKDPVTDVLPDSVVWRVYEDRQQNIWLGMHSGGLARYDRASGQFQRYISEPDNLKTLSNQLVWTVYQDSKDQLWVGTASGFNLFNPDTGEFKRYLPNSEKEDSLANGSALSIFEDSKQRLWVGTDAGLHLFNQETDGFTVYTTKDGFVDHGIRSIVEDQEGNLWLGTNNGIVRFNPDTLDVKNYKQYNGQAFGGMNTNAATVTQKGEVVFGSNAGLIIIDTKKLGINPTPPPVVLTDFRVFTKPVEINAEDGLLTKVVNQSESIVLDYEKTMFSFYFSALNYRNSEKNQYAYKLEGFDNDWREVGTQRKAQYTNLSAGNYTFRVKASNNDGVWNDEGAAIAIKQLPPPWKTWWAYSIYSLLILAIIANFIHSQRKKRKAIEEQNRILEQRVAERTADLAQKNNDIQAMLSNMKQGLFTIEVDGNIHPEYSKHLESIFETQDLAGRNAFDLLFAKSQLGSNTLDQNKEAIGSILGEDEMNFEFNAHLLIDEYPLQLEQQLKYLSLSWDPILDDEDCVSKLMVSVRDVTELKQMESEAQSKKRELDIISQLINVAAKKYNAFIDSAFAFVEQNRKQIKLHSEKDNEVIALLFRNMHTIKGNCRTFDFRILSDVVHDVESVYSELKSNADMPWDKECLMAGLDKVEACLNEYQHVYIEVLGRERSSSKRDPNGFWMDSKAIASVESSMDLAINKHEDLEPVFRSVRQIIDRGLTTPFTQVLGDIVHSLSSIASQLGKEPPHVLIEDKGVRVKESAQELLNNTFAHLLRNCVDHGIEAPEQRAEIGKSPAGIITIKLEAKSKSLHINVMDDGQGLNLNRLHKKGQEQGLWQKDQQPLYSEIAELIFCSGVSTKDIVTDVSGRGVGMDAVKQFLNQASGDIKMRLLEEDKAFKLDEKEQFVKIEFCIELPQTLFSLVDFKA